MLLNANKKDELYQRIIVDYKQNLQITHLSTPFVLKSYKKYFDKYTMTQIRGCMNEKGVKKLYKSSFSTQ